jgi:D-3-phosphoglycerate dehydrogenase
MVARGATLGVYGYGRIGRVVAGYGDAFGMAVQVWGRPESRARAADEGRAVTTSRAEFFATARPHPAPAAGRGDPGHGPTWRR